MKLILVLFIVIAAQSAIGRMIKKPCARYFCYGSEIICSKQADCRPSNVCGPEKTFEDICELEYFNCRHPFTSKFLYSFRLEGFFQINLYDCRIYFFTKWKMLSG